MKLKRNWKPKPMMKPKGGSKRIQSTMLQKPYIEKVKEECGDHCFACIRARYCGYWYWYDQIRDSMHEVFRRLGHLAEIMHSKDDVVRELLCLVRLDWNKCPADIFILLNAYHLKSNRKSDWMCVLCNFTTRKTPDGTLTAMQDTVTQTYVISNQPRSENLKDHHWDRTRMHVAQSQGTS